MSREVLVVGTRPELVKMAPVVRALDASDGLTPRHLHTGQHYDDSFTDDFFELLGLPDPVTRFDVGSGS